MIIINYDVCGGGLEVDCISWKEKQSCPPAIRDVPTRSTGAHVDAGTFTLKARILSIILRLNDSQKATLQDIFGWNTTILIFANIDGDAGNWIYDAWLSKKPLIYEYKSSGGSNLREWRAELEFKVRSFAYS